jgi:hypothetical protein
VINGVESKAEAVGAVTEGQFERRVDVSLFEVAGDVQVVLALAAVGQTAEELGIRVEVEDDGLVIGKEGSVFQAA